MPSKKSAVKAVMGDIDDFCSRASHLELRDYQLPVARAIARSVFDKLGHSFVIVFPRQSGKNEIQAQLEAYLLASFAQRRCEIVAVSPTYKPQTVNAMYRLQRILRRNPITQDIWRKEAGFTFVLGDARISFLSGYPQSNVVGATASMLLMCDEAQEISTAKWDKEFAPMAASANATRVFWGTAWTSKTLLARELKVARAAEMNDRIQRVFTLTADDVRQEVPAYGAFVDDQVARLGRNHPFVKTQYFSEEIDAEGALFDERRIGLMKGTHRLQTEPKPGATYVFTLDLAGEEEATEEFEEIQNKGRDSTALTIFEVDFSSIADELIKQPTYRTVNRQEWTGTKHTALYGQIKALIDQWSPRFVVVDATGIGAGIASFLEKAFPALVIQFVFTAKSKSDLAWSFLATIETGRYKEYKPTRSQAAGSLAQLQNVFFQQAEYCQQRVLEGPGKMIRWGVPDGTRNQVTGELVHDDLLISAAMVSVLDAQEWGLAQSEVIQTFDPLEGFKDAY